MSAWQTILVAFGGNAVLLAVLGHLGKSLLERSFERDSIRFQHELKAKADLAIEEFKNSLQLRAVEHQIRFGALHERQAQLIADLYARLVELRSASTDFVKHYYLRRRANQRAATLERLRSAAEAFDSHFAANRIYFEKSVCVALDTLRSELDKAVSLLADFAADSTLIETEEQVFGEWEAALATIERQVPAINDSLETTFRRLLGVQASE
jgi:hypothetical protein